MSKLVREEQKHRGRKMSRYREKVDDRKKIERRWRRKKR